MRCQRCDKEVLAAGAFCPHCGAPQDEAPTVASSGAASAPKVSDSGHHGRFLPGATVAERYRIVGLLGRGGMGEVYRADDLKLDQQVALKFLPAELSADREHLARLFDEVRMARQVSHPNVCRVWDVGESDGQHYVSMEYVDGEDLASLLRRIGRLPEDKAVEIARQLCAALAAAHDAGVLHRDLKPANIMLDGRGKVKLTDFGLAAVAEVRAGTPMYMAPEQLAGREVSAKSDLYALGLVLHELFTGKRVFDADSFDDLSRQHQTAPTTSLTHSLALDPAVDRIIQRCLEADPAKRPSSALAVAAGLPGADPLAAALAAGETPSPEMVAEAGGEGSLPLAVAAPLLLFTLIGAVAVGALQARTSLVGWVPFDTPPAVLDARAREIVATLGYGDEFGDTASGYSTDLGYARDFLDEDAGEEQWAAVAGGRPASIAFWWRGSPETLDPLQQGLSPSLSVSLANPPRTVPGMVSLQIDNAGRLLWLDVVAERAAGAGDAATPDWSVLFDLMGLPMADFEPVPPGALPEHFADQRAAWSGAYPEDPQASLRIEAAAWQGSPISLRLFPAWDPLEPTSDAGSSGSGLGLAIITLTVVAIWLAMILTAIFGGLYVAHRNLRSGRGDARGARRLGFAVAIGLGLEWLLDGPPLTFVLFNHVLNVLVFLAAAGGLSWALYLAVEPFMRRHAPAALIGWTRLIDGRLADPLVGRDVLLGCAAGTLSRGLDVLPVLVSGRPAIVANYLGLPAQSVIELLAGTIGFATQSVIVGLALSFLYGLTFVALRRRSWLAGLAWLLFLGGIGFLPGLTVNNTAPAATTATSVFWLIGWALTLWVLLRWGILAFLVMSTTAAVLADALPTLDLSAWYASDIVAGLALVAGLAGYAFYRCVEWRGGLAEAMAGD